MPKSFLRFISSILPRLWDTDNSLPIFLQYALSSPIDEQKRTKQNITGKISVIYFNLERCVSVHFLFLYQDLCQRVPFPALRIVREGKGTYTGGCYDRSIQNRIITAFCAVISYRVLAPHSSALHTWVALTSTANYLIYNKLTTCLLLLKVSFQEHFCLLSNHKY